VITNDTIVPVVVLVVPIVSLFLVRFFCLIFFDLPRHRRHGTIQQNQHMDLRNRIPLRTIIVLGSGGHTTEMLQLIQHLDWPRKFHPLVFVIASTDTTSLDRLQHMMGPVVEALGSVYHPSCTRSGTILCMEYQKFPHCHVICIASRMEDPPGPDRSEWTWYMCPYCYCILSLAMYLTTVVIITTRFTVIAAIIIVNTKNNVSLFDCY
jgi:hypothetical protein